MSYLQSLPVFFSVVEEGSFSGAAKKLNLTQPTVSFHIDNLEKRLGCQLFIRTLRGVSPTVYGEKLYYSTNKIEAVVQETYREIQSMVNGNAGHIVIGSSTIPADYILPPLVSSFLKSHPGIRVTVRSGDSANILAAFHQNEVAIAIIGQQPPEGKDSLSQPLWQDELLLVAHPDVGREIKNLSSPSVLQGVPMVIRETSSGTRKTFTTALHAKGINLADCSVVLEVSSNEALKSAVIHQVGAGFVSRRAVDKELSSGILTAVPLPELIVKRQFYGLVNMPLLPTCMKDFWDFLCAAAADITEQS